MPTLSSFHLKTLFMHNRLLFVLFFLPLAGLCQQIEKVTFNPADSSNGYYLAIAPQSKHIEATVVLIASFGNPEGLLPETRLHNVAYANNMLTIMATMNGAWYANDYAMKRLDALIKHVVDKYHVDPSTFVLAGFDLAGNLALRYTELTHERPAGFIVHPKAVFAVESPVDLFGFWRKCERQIKKNYYPGTVGESKYFLDVMTKENGTIYNQPGNYQKLSPFYMDSDSTGNERYLQNVAVRLYYDTDINWHLKNRRNSLYDTNIPDGSELINRLLLMGNENAEFVSAKQPGMLSNGMRMPYSLSIVDAPECIQWIKSKLGIFDPVTYVPAYTLFTPGKWDLERFPIPIEFAPQIAYKGVEDLRFAPGWGDAASEEYWSYAFLWWLEGKPVLDAATFQQNLKDYYSGLVGRNIISRKIPAEKVVPVNTKITKIKTAANDLATYTGTVSMLDYMAQKPVVLNCVIHVKNCSARTAVIFEVSPKPAGHAVWQNLDKIGNEFECR